MVKKIFIPILCALILSAATGITAFADSAEDNIEAKEETVAAETADSTVPMTSDSVSDNSVETANNSSAVYDSTSTLDSYNSSLSSSDSDTDTSKSETNKVLDDDEYGLIRNLVDELAKENEKKDYYADPHYDTDGNGSLVDNQQIIYNSAEMQFISVTTKDGHVFYVLINYSAKKGEDNVYFLNKVDDFDLYALLYADDSENDMTPKEAADLALGENEKEPAEEGYAEAEPSREEDFESSESQNSSNNMMIYGIGALCILGAAFYFSKNKKGNNKAKTPKEDLDDFDYDNDDVEIDE